MRRDKLRILISILEICSEDEMNKTRIVYQTSINFRAATLYLDMLTQEGLVKVVNPGSRGRYATTEKGREILKRIKHVYDRLELYSLE